VPVHSEATDAAFASALPAIAAQLHLGIVSGFRVVPEGLMNLNWRVWTSAGAYAVKELTDASTQDALRNLSLLPALSQAGIPLALPALTEDGDPVVSVGGRAYCALPWLEGEHRHGTRLTTAQARHLGVFTARLHEAMAAILPQPLPAPESPLATVELALADCAKYLDLAQQATSRSAFDAEVAALIKERRNLITGYARQRPGGAAPQPAGWTHGDLQHRNLLWADSNIVGVLDWDRVRVRPLGEEIVRTASVHFTHPDGAMELGLIASFVAGYRSVTEIEDVDLALAAQWHWWNRLCSLWPLKFHYERGDPGCDHFFFLEYGLVQWWNARRGEVQEAFTHRR